MQHNIRAFQDRDSYNESRGTLAMGNINLNACSNLQSYLSNLLFPTIVLRKSSNRVTQILKFMFWVAKVPRDS